MLLVPAIDLRGGRCVRLVQGRFDAETVHADDPMMLLEQFVELGARHVHVVDLDAARSAAHDNRDAVARLAKARLATLQLGGGIRSRETAERWLALGIERVVVGSRAATDPSDVATWLRELGGTRIVLAFDVRIDTQGIPRLATHGWETQTQTSLWDAVELYAEDGLQHVLCTDVSRDGSLTGPNLDLYAEATRRFPRIAWQASGGVASSADLAALAATGVTAAISGRALLEGRLSHTEIEPYLRSA